MARTYLEFEKAIAEVDGRIARLSREGGDAAQRNANDRARLAARLDRALRQAYRRLTPWQVVQVARHPDRPRAPAYVDGLVEDFMPLSGDPSAPERPRMIGGLGRIRGYSALILAQDRQGGRSDGPADASCLRMAEGVLRLADRLSMPVVSLVDTPVADRGDTRDGGAAVVACIEAALDLRSPAVAVVIGEAAGADAQRLWVADRILMMEHAVVYPAPPEVATETLWQDAAQVRVAAEVLKPTAQDQAQLGLTDEIVSEPLGGAHRDPAAAVSAVGDAIARALAELVEVGSAELRRRRRERALALGAAGSRGSA